MKILVVEDSLAVRDFYHNILQEAGFEVIPAVDGAEGIEKLFNSPDIALIISDVDMALMNGYTMIERVRQEKRFAGVPIIITSNGYRTLDKQRGFAAGVDAYIFKPIEPEILVENINLLTLTTN
jgi:DNA-binding response OmpR family regulator